MVDLLLVEGGRVAQTDPLRVVNAASLTLLIETADVVADDSVVVVVIERAIKKVLH